VLGVQTLSKEPKMIRVQNLPGIDEVLSKEENEMS
jgi:hypothetical protein